MYLNMLNFIDLSSIHKPTIVFVLVLQVIIFTILFLLYKLFRSKVSALHTTKRKQNEVSEIKPPEKTVLTESDGDINAAIAMALYLHFNEMHDQESNVITIQRVSKTYSPWSSKIYSMRNFR